MQCSGYQCLNAEWELQVQPKEVLGVRRLLNGTEQVLILWEGLPEDENTWEISQVLPEFNHEDKVALVGVSVDRPLKYVYRRKGRKEKEREETEA